MKIHIDTEKKKVKIIGNSKELDLNTDTKMVGVNSDNFELIKLFIDKNYHLHIKVIYDE